MPRAGGDDGRAGVRGGLGESQALNECRAGGVRWVVGSLGLVERGLEKSCRRGGGKGTSKLKGVKGEFRVGDEETVCLGHRRECEGVLSYLDGGTWGKGPLRNKNVL